LTESSGTDHFLFSLIFSRIGRGLYHQVCGITLSSKEEKWNKIKFCVFDLPNVDAPYEERLAKLKSLGLPSNVVVVDSAKCTGAEMLTQRLREITNANGEGLILRDPNATYKQGRSGALRRLKVLCTHTVKLISAAV
jgi:DNA ligase-1